MRNWSRLAAVVAMAGIAITTPARADWFTKLLTWGAIGSVVAYVASRGLKTKDEVLLDLRQRSATAIQETRHERSCDLRRRDFEAILPIAAEAPTPIRRRTRRASRASS